MNHNKFDLKVGDTVILDKGYANESKVTILEFTDKQLYAKIKPAEAITDTSWDVMTYRLKPII